MNTGNRRREIKYKTRKTPFKTIWTLDFDVSFQVRRSTEVDTEITILVDDAVHRSLTVTPVWHQWVLPHGAAQKKHTNVVVEIRIEAGCIEWKPISKHSLIACERWGSTVSVPEDATAVFAGCDMLTHVGDDFPFHRIIQSNYMFFGCTELSIERSELLSIPLLDCLWDGDKAEENGKVEELGIQHMFARCSKVNPPTKTHAMYRELHVFL